MAARILWAAMLLGQVVFVAVVLVVLGPKGSGVGSNRAVGQGLYYAALIAVGPMVAAGVFVRGLIFKKGMQQRGGVAPQAYFQGNIVFLALCEGVSMVGLVGVLLSGVFWPNVVPSLVAMGVQAVNFPTGSAMRGPMDRVRSPR